MSNRVSNFQLYSALEHEVLFPLKPVRAVCMQIIGTQVLRSQPIKYILACDLGKKYSFIALTLYYGRIP